MKTKKFTALLLSLLMVVTMFSLASVTALTADAAETVVYVNQAGSQMLQSANKLTPTTTSLTELWYYVSGNVVINNNLSVAKSTSIILFDGANLTVTDGITVEVSLNIYGQTEGTGTMTVSASDGMAAITGHTLAVKGGNVILRGGDGTTVGGAGAEMTSGVNVMRGNLTATGGDAATGTGGNGISGMILSVNGGNVTAIGGNQNSGIGGNGVSLTGNLVAKTEALTAKGGVNADAIAFGSSSRASINESLEVKADNNNPPKTVITDTSALTTSLVGKRYLKIATPAPKYNVTVDENIENGTVTADKATAEKDETVTLTVTPASGYELDTITVTNTDDTTSIITVTDNTFTMPEYDVTVTASFKAAHVHNRKYTADGATLTAECTCGDTQTLTLKATNKTFDTEAIAVTLEGSVDGVTLADVKYYNGETELAAAPVNAGTYTARITKGDATATVECVISPCQITVEGSTVSSKNYDGTTSATVTPGVLNGVIMGTSVSIDTAIGTFDNADVGTDKAVSVSYTLKGDDAENYTIENETLSGEITAAVPTVSTLEKTYAECKKITLAVPEIKGVDGEALEGVTVEYAINTENTAPETGWQTSTEFTKLKANTTYYFFVKVTVNDNTNYSDYISEGVAIATNAHEMTKYGYVASTCTVQGHNTYYKCNVCKNVYVDKEGTHVTTAKAQARKLTKHKLTYFGGYAPTCTRAGRIAYYQCSVCKKVFKDEAATKEITLAEVKLSAKTHSLVKVAYKKATCTETGNYTYYKCTTCGKCYIYSDGTKLTSEKDQTIKLKAHKLSLVAEKEATATENGNIAYYKCSGCTKIFLDENGTNETTYEAVTVSYTED